MEELKCLVIAAQDGDKEAFGEIIERFQDMAFAVAFAMLGEAYLAEDASQEAFLDAYQSIAKLREPAAFPAWFRRVVIKHSDRQTRGKRPQTLPLEQAVSIPSKAVDPEVAVERRQIRQAVQEAIKALPKDQRLATALYYIQGYSQKEIAETLELPVTTIKKSLYTARQRLKRRMVVMIQNDLQANKPSNDDRFADKVRFFIALKTGNLEQVKELIKENRDLLHEKTEWGIASDGYYWPLGITALHWAAGTGNKELAGFLLSQGANVNSMGKASKTPLHIAVLMGQREIVELLLSHGADPNARTELGHTPLHFAVMRGHLAIVKILLKNGAKASSRDESGRTPADWAAIKGQAEMVDLLVEQGAQKPDRVSGRSPLESKWHKPTRQVLVGEELLGRVLNAKGKSEDGSAEITRAPQKPIMRPVVQSTSQSLETAIKIIDLFAPLKRGGQNGIFTPIPGLGKFVVLNQIVANVAWLHDGYTVSLGLEEGAYTGDSLMLAWRDWGVEKRTVNVFDRRGKADANCMRIAETGLTIAEHFQNQGHEVLLVIDSSLALCNGVADFLRENCAIGQRAAITTLFFGDHSVGAEPESLVDLDAVITFDPARAQAALWPAIDPIRSRSKLLETGLLGKNHASAASAAFRLFRRAQDLKTIVENQGLEALEAEDRQVVRRAGLLQRFLTQPFSGAEPWTGIPGENVRIEDTIRGCQEILEGRYDSLPEEAFCFVGTIEQALEKAKNR